MKKWSVRHMVIIAMLVALRVVLARFASFSAWNVRIGFSFLPTALAGILYGPLSAAVVGGLGDFIGAILFPSGAFFPGFTFTAALLGVIFALFLHKKMTPLRIILCVVTEMVICTMLLNSLWISILYGSSFKALFATRLYQAAILGPVHILTLFGVKAVLDKYGRRLFE